MGPVELLAMLPQLRAQRPVWVLGSAVIDVIAETETLPSPGSDIELHQQDISLGGCGLNIALTLSRLGIGSQNALPIGQGPWAEVLRNGLMKQQIRSAIHTNIGDNGWCLALVEPNGERTFMSFRGVEHRWNRAWLDALKVTEGTLLSLSGYQLAGPCAELLVGWLESLRGVTAFIDFGPRIGNISPPLLARIMACRPIVSLNRQEAATVAGWLNVKAEDTAALCHAWLARYGSPLIVRLDKDGAWFADTHGVSTAPPFPTVVIDAIGAGDSHTGATLAGLAAGWPLDAAVSLGNAVASYVVGHRGGDCAPTLTQLERTLLFADKNV